MYVPQKYIPTFFNELTHHVWAHSMLELIELMKVRGSYSLALIHDMKLAVQSGNGEELGYEPVDYWKGKHIKLMEIKKVMTGSFRVHDAVTKYLSGDNTIGRFESSGHSYVMEADGTLRRDGEIILRAIRSDGPPMVLRVAGTAKDDYSFTLEIPVKMIDGDDMHKINYEYFSEMIESTISSPAFRASDHKTNKFRQIIGVRYWAERYAKHFNLPDLPITTLEMAELARMALLEGDSTELYRIRGMYSQLYDLPKGGSIQDIGLIQSDLNSVSTSQA